MKIDVTKNNLQKAIHPKENESSKQQVLTDRPAQFSDEKFKTASQCITNSRMAEISFKAKPDNASNRVSKEDLQKLVNEKRKVAEICEILNITNAQYKNLIKKYGIVTARKTAKDNVSSITKEQFSALIEEGKSAKEICETLHIGSTTYENLLKRFGITTNYQIVCQITDNITKEMLQEKLDSGQEPKEIAKELGISVATCLNHIKKYGLKSNGLITKENASSITKETLTKLIDSGKSRKEICEELNIGVSTYNRLLHRFGIATSQIEALQKNSEITKEKLQAVVDEDLPLKEACGKLGISKSTYNVLLTKYGIKTKTMLNKERLASITEDQFRSLVKAGLTAEEIQKELGISTKFYYTLMRKFNIEVKKYDVKGNNDSLNEKIEELFSQDFSIKEIAEELNITEDMCRRLLKNKGYVLKRTDLQNKKSQITKEQVLEVLAKGKTVKESYEELGLTENSYYSLLSKFGIKTNLQKRKEEIAAITVSQIQDLLSENKSLPEICNALNISESSFYSILAKHNVKTQKQLDLEHNRTISKEMFENLINQNKTAKQICDELNIPPSRYNYLKFIFGLTQKAKADIQEKRLEDCSCAELKEHLIDLYIENEQINKIDLFSIIIDYINDKDYQDISEKQDLIQFAKLLNNIAQNKLAINEGISNPLTQRFVNEIEKNEREEQEKQEKFEIQLAQFYGVIEHLAQNNMVDVTAICYKYIPQDINDKKAKIIESMLKMIKDVTNNEKKPIEQLNKIKRNLIYLDATIDPTMKKELDEAKIFCEKNYENKNPEKIGQIIENKRIYNDYLNTGTITKYPQDFVDLIKEKSAKFGPKYESSNALRYMIKLDNWFNSDMAAKNQLNDFLKIFTTDRLIDNAIIQHFIETIYTKEDTCAVAIASNGREQETIIPAETKSKIYSYRKYPNALRYLCAFEEAMQEFAPPTGTTGIKIETTGKKRIKLKIAGIPDRIFSTNKDYRFDDYSPTGDH